MIDYYYKTESFDVGKRVKECEDYYDDKHHSYNELYEIYDKLSKQVGKVIPDNNTFVFFKKSGSLKTHMSEFMIACLIEALKRHTERRIRLDMKDSDSKLDGEVSDYKSGNGETNGKFNYYPDTCESNISKKLLSKTELRRHIIPVETGQISDKCNNDYFELSPHQIFLKNLLSPNTQYRSLLIFHGVGVGKTCSGISIAENFKDVYGSEENRVIILASQNIQIGWRKTIYDPRKGSDQCTGQEYLMDDDESNETINDKSAKKKVKKYYELHGYSAFANSVKKLLRLSCQHIIDPKQHYLAEIAIIKKVYSSRVLIIDEVHNIRASQSEKESRDTIHYIEMVIKHSDNLRLILLTANPMYNMSTEIVWIINMLLLNDKKTILNESDVFDNDNNLINGELLTDKCSGYISYLRGENPISFPVRLYPRHDIEKMIKNPGSSAPVPIIQSQNIFGGQINEEDRLSFLELYGSKLKGHQLKIYQSAMGEYKDKEKLRIEDETSLLQMSNIIYPGQNDDDVRELYGESGLLNNMNELSSQGQIQYSYKDDSPESHFFHRDKIGDYSAKIENILEIIGKSSGIVFIYTNWIKSGVIPLLLALEQNGYTKNDGKPVLKTKGKIEKISHEGKYISDYSDKKNFKSAKYMVISGSSGTKIQLEEELRIVSSEGNKEGKRIKVIIGSSVASEGLDFKNIRTIHVLEPWHNINKIEQVIGRGIRNCSHKLLDAKERNVTVYLHSSVVPDKESIDMYLYRYSEKKAQQIGKIENILKMGAVDKYFFKNVNHLSEKDIGNFRCEPAYRYDNGLTKSFTYKGGDKAWSRVCSFSKTCDYMKDDKSGKIIPDNDTYQVQYSSSIIDVYKKRIHNLYLESVTYTLDELVSKLSTNMVLHDDYLYHALREMEVEKWPLHNKNGDRGYLTSNDGHYNFQPYFNADKLLSSYYRLNKGMQVRSDYTIESKLKRATDIILTEQDLSHRVTEIHDMVTKYAFQAHELRILEYLNMMDNNRVKIGYICDRLSFDEKLILGYSIMGYLKEEREKDSFMEILVLCFEKLFIYQDGSKFMYKDKYSGEKGLCGFFLYHNLNRRPVFYSYSAGIIEVYNKVDEIDLSRMVKSAQSNKSFQLKGSWGFTTYSERLKSQEHNRNGIVLKVIKKGDKLRKNYVYPPGPGVVIQDSGGLGAWHSQPMLEFIDKEFKVEMDSMSTANKEIFMKSDKSDYVSFIELSLRARGQLIQNDLIFMKYY